MRFKRKAAAALAIAIAAGGAALGCGSEEAFEPRLASTERSVEREAVARFLSDDQVVGQVTVVGDIDGDGVDDAIARTEYLISGPKGALALGSGIFVIYGGRGITGKIDLASLPTLTGAGALDGRIAALGDVDGDGLDDFLVGIGRTPGCGTELVKLGEAPSNGGAFLVYGSATRLTGVTPIASVAALLRDPTPCMLADGVAGLGDLDGDGKADFAISWNPMFHGPGLVYVYYGRGDRLTGTLDLVATADAVISPAVSWVDPLWRVGDIDHDGRGDFIVTGHSEELSRDVRLVRGSATRLTGTVSLAGIAQTRFSTDELCRFSSLRQVTALGDLDGDGRDDFALVRCDMAQEAIEQHVFYGRAEGFPAEIADGDEDATIEIVPGLGQIAGADVDGDGTRDLIVTETDAKDGNGAVHVLPGAGERLSGTIKPTGRGLTYVGMPQRAGNCDYAAGCVLSERLGDTLGVGDLTGSQGADLLVSGPTNQLAAPVLGQRGTASGHLYLVSQAANR